MQQKENVGNAVLLNQLKTLIKIHNKVMVIIYIVNNAEAWKEKLIITE